MTFMLQHIEVDHGKFIRAKISITAVADSPTAIILPGKPVGDGSVASLAEMLIDHGFACCLPSTKVEVQDARALPKHQSSQ